MSKLCLILLGLLALGAAIYFASSPATQEKINFERFKQSQWFGLAKDVQNDTLEIRTFNLNISDAELSDLQSRLLNARFVDHIQDTNFTYGFNSVYLKEVVEYWKTKYDWRMQETELNSFPQFKTQIEGLDIHFVHVKPSKKAKTIIPILLIHGWPGSFYEYYKSLPLLIEPDENGLVFEVIIPSIPGFGYSEAPHKQGFDVAASARIFRKLMARLGHEKFVAHGGDWGNVIARFMAAAYEENMIGVHLLGNWDAMGMMDSFSGAFRAFLAAYFPSLVFDSENVVHEQSKLFPLWDRISMFITETGYYHLQATKPDTLAASLVDSPVGLAAYILEKFSTWTNPDNREKDDGGLTEKFSLDELITNVMIYWTSGNVASSVRFYKENVAKMDEFSGAKVLVPAATVDSSNEMIRTPRALLEKNYAALVQYTEMPQTGHFTAFEVPELVCGDIRQFVHKIIQNADNKTESN